MPQEFRKTRPDKHTARAAWERSWEEDLNKIYHSEGNAEDEFRHLAMYVPPGSSVAEILDEVALSLHDDVRVICQSQKKLARETVLAFSRNDFENKWLSTPDEKRREAILEGIYRTMCLPDMERRREYCPDSTLSYLASGGGGAYIKMLKTALPADIYALVAEPSHFPHPIMDRVLSLSSEKYTPEAAAMIRMERLRRTYFLTELTWSIWHAFRGKRPETFIMKPPRVEPVSIRSDPSLFGRATAVKIQSHNVARKLENAIYTCTVCVKHEENPDHGRKLLACSQCRNVGRKVWYCSRECQKEDWKNGIPRPHKDICGRLLGEEDVAAMIAQAQDRLISSPQSGGARPRSGYKPSPALLHQIVLLTENPDVDYWLVPPSPTPEIPIVCSGLQYKTRFRELREKAFSSGDPETVTTMFLQLKFLNCGVHSRDIQRQLDREFGPGTVQNMEIVNPLYD